MEQIQKILDVYGLPALIISAIIIFVVGTLKYFKVFDKIPKDWRKFVFYAIDLALSFGFVAIYYAIFNMPFDNYVWLTFGTDSAVIIVYALYENCGLRKLLQIVGNFIVSVVANEKVKAKVQEITNSIPEENQSNQVK